MDFYPHNIGGNNIVVANATTATLAVTSSLINNFAAVGINLVDTASVGENIRGPAGANGTNASPSIKGPTGAQGATGVQGFRGLNIWLLSSSWAEGCAGAPVTCYSITLNKYVGGTCTSQPSSPFYTTRVNASNQIIEGLSPIYQDSVCTTVMPAGTRLGNDGTLVYNVNVNNTASFFASCASGPMCNAFELFNTGSASGECNTSQGGGVYYTTSSLSVVESNIVGDADNTIVYTNSTCTSVAQNLSTHNLQGVIFTINNSGVVLTSACTS